MAEIATVLEIGERTVKRELRMGRLFLKQQLETRGMIFRQVRAVEALARRRSTFLPPFGGLHGLAPSTVEFHNPFACAVQVIPVRNRHAFLTG